MHNESLKIKMSWGSVVFAYKEKCFFLKDLDS